MLRLSAEQRGVAQGDAGEGKVGMLLAGTAVLGLGVMLAAVGLSSLTGGDDKGEGYVSCGDSFEFSNLGKDDQTSEIRFVRAIATEGQEGQGGRSDTPETTGYIALRATYLGEGSEIRDKDGVRVEGTHMFPSVEEAKGALDNPSTTDNGDATADNDTKKLRGEQFIYHPDGSDDVTSIHIQFAGSLEDPKIAGKINCG